MLKFSKLLAVVLIPLFSFALCSCKDDKDEPQNPPQPDNSENQFSIIGTWVNEEDPEDYMFEFKSNGIVSETDKGNTEDTYYKFDSKQGKLWIYMFGLDGVETYPLADLENYDEYNIQVINKDKFILSYELDGKLEKEHYKRVTT